MVHSTLVSDEFDNLSMFGKHSRQRRLKIMLDYDFSIFIPTRELLEMP